MSNKHPRPVLHRRDHEHGGADVVRILWEDDAPDPEPDPVTGGWKEVPVNITLTTGLSGPAVLYAGTFHDGTIPGLWQLGTGDSTVTPAGTPGTWLVTFTGTLSNPPTPVVSNLVEVWFEHDFDTAGRAEIFNDTLDEGETVPLSYSTTLVEPFEVGLPVAVRTGGTIAVTLDGTMTFVWT